MAETRTFRFAAQRRHLSLQHLLGVIALAAAIAVSLWALNDVYLSEAHTRLLPAVGTAAALSLFLWLCGAPFWTSLPAQLLTYSTIGGALLFPDTLTAGLPLLDTWRAVWTHTISGWSDLLSLPLPIEATDELLAMPMLVAWLTTWAAVEISVRTRRPAAATLPVLVAITLFAALGPATRPTWTVVALVIVAIVAHLWLAGDAALAHEDEQRGAAVAKVGSASAARIAFASGLPVLLLVGSLGAAVLRTDQVSDADRWDPRADFVPIVERRDRVSPLALVKGFVNDADQTVHFQVALDGDAAVDGSVYFRTAALDSYDGALWSSDALFVRVQSALAPTPDAPVGQDGRQVAVSIDLTDDYPSQYIPVLGAPTRVEGTIAGHHAASQTLIHDGATGASEQYQLVAVVPPSLEDVGLFNASTDADLGRYKTLPGDVPEQLTAFVADSVGEAGGAATQVRALVEALTGDDFGYDTLNAHGHNYAAVAQYLGTDEDDSAQTPVRTGFGEQSAASFALLARLQGIPARVAVGYAIDVDRLADGPATVMAADAHAWAEIFIDDIGWVVVDPIERQEATMEPPQLPAVDTSDVITNPEDAPLLPPVRDITAPPEPGAGTSPLWLLIVPALLLLAIPVAKAMRRAHRRRGDAPAAAHGAWLEATDRLREHGVAPSTVTTPLETLHEAELAGRIEPDHQLRHLATIAGAAAWSPQGVTAEQAAEAWEGERTLRRALRRSRGRFRMARASFDPRPLFPSRRAIAPEPTDPFDAAFSLFDRPLHTIDQLHARGDETPPHSDRALHDPSPVDPVVLDPEGSAESWTG